MPIFDFRCSECNKTFETLVLGANVPRCPNCNSERLEKLVSAPAAPGKSAELISRARTQAAKEGHFSNYSPADKPRRK